MNNPIRDRSPIEGDIRHNYPPGTLLGNIVEFEIYVNGEWIHSSKAKDMIFRAQDGGGR